MPPGPSRNTSILVVMLATLVACRDVPDPPARPTTLQTHPRAMFRLARLMRAEYRDSLPARIEQEIACESERVKRVLGADFEVRRRHLADSLGVEFPAEQTRLLGVRLTGVAVAPGTDPVCNDINAAAEREVRLDTARVNEERR